MEGGAAGHTFARGQEILLKVRDEPIKSRIRIEIERGEVHGEGEPPSEMVESQRAIGIIGARIVFVAD